MRPQAQASAEGEVRISSCSRCGRVHSGLCGIPHMVVRRDMGPGPRGGTIPVKPFPVNRETAAPGRGQARLLEALLAEVKGKQGELSRRLNQLPHHLPDYDRILEELDKSMRAEESLRRQLARR